MSNMDFSELRETVNWIRGVELELSNMHWMFDMLVKDKPKLFYGGDTTTVNSSFDRLREDISTLKLNLSQPLRREELILGER